MTHLHKIKIVIVTGQICSGKSLLLDYISKQNFISYEWGAIFKKYLNNNLTRIDMLREIKSQINKYGRNYFTEKVIDEISTLYKKNPDTNGVFLAGARHPCELNYLLGYFDNAKVLHIHCDTLERFNRNLKRNRTSDPNELKEFIKVDMQELHLGLSEIISEYIQDLILNNEGVDEFYSKINKYIESLN